MLRIRSKAHEGRWQRLTGGRRTLSANAFAILSLLVGLSAPLNAWQQLYTFQELERRAVLENYDTQAVLERIRAVEHEKSVESARLWPRVSGSYRYYSGDISSFDDVFFGRHLWNVRLTQDLSGLLSGSSGRLGQLQAESDLMDTQLTKIRKTALHEFRRDYLEILADRARVSLYQELVIKYQELRDLHFARYKHQEGLLTDVLQVETEQEEIQAALTYHQSRLQRQAQLLAEYFGLPTEALAWNEISLTPPVIIEEELLDLALKNHDDLKLNSHKAKIEASRAPSSFFSDLRLTPYVGFRWRGRGRATLPTGPEAGISMTMPLGFLKKRQHLSQQVAARQSAYRLNAQQIRFDVKKAISLAVQHYSLVGSQLKTNQKRIELNEERLRIERSKLKQEVSGLKADPAHLLTLEAESIKLKLQQKLKAYERLQAYYQLLHLSGLSFPNELQPRLAELENDGDRTYPTALWLWSPQQLMLSDRDRKAFVEFCTSRGISQVYISVNTAVMASLQQGSAVQKFVSQLHEAGMSVSALFGEPSWVTPSHRKNLIEKIEALLSYNILATKSAQFDAVHLDVEPHALPEWNRHKEALLRKFVETVRAVSRTIATRQPEMELELDIPTFFDKIDREALRTLVELADSITIMAYQRTDAVKLLQSVKETIYLCQAVNTRCVLGLNAKDFDNEQRLQALMADLGPMVAKIIRTPRFAIHDYHHYRDLAKR